MIHFYQIRANSAEHFASLSWTIDGIWINSEHNLFLLYRIRYVHLMAHFRMYRQIRDQTLAFIRGFKAVVNPEWLSMFSSPELQKLISGDTADMDIGDLRWVTFILWCYTMMIMFIGALVIFENPELYLVSTMFLPYISKHKSFEWLICYHKLRIDRVHI